MSILKEEREEQQHENYLNICITEFYMITHMKKMFIILSVCKIDVFLIKYLCWVWFIALVGKIAPVILFFNYLFESLFFSFVFHDI